MPAVPVPAAAAGKRTEEFGRHHTYLFGFKAWDVESPEINNLIRLSIYISRIIQPKETKGDLRWLPDQVEDDGRFLWIAPPKTVAGKAETSRVMTAWGAGNNSSEKPSADSYRFGKLKSLSC